MTNNNNNSWMLRAHHAAADAVAQKRHWLLVQLLTSRALRGGENYTRRYVMFYD